VTGFLVGLIMGGAVVWIVVRRREPGAASPVADAAGAHLLPDPALRWLMRAHGALGVWIAERDPDGGEPIAERVVDAERLEVAQIAAINRRVERARDQAQSGAERVDGGTLVYRGANDVGVALLLPDGAGPAALAAVETDLQHLLDGVRRRPQIVALAQATGQGGALESLESVALRLAYQLERATGADVVVGAQEAGGTRIVGVSAGADQRLRGTFAAPASDLARVAAGHVAQTSAVGDPLGGVVADRRRRVTRALVLPLEAGRTVVGAVAIWPREGIELVGPQLAEVLEAVANAAPRMSEAREADSLQANALTDQLTSLPNRRGLEIATRRFDIQEAALIACDLDNFKVLNDTLGHAAGDAALAHFARLLREQVRGGDTAARTGGEEFAVWLPNTSLDVARQVAERIRIKLGTTPWDWQGRRWPLSASFGVASCPETSRHLDNLPAQADAALYVAKGTGRNRVEAAARLQP
jgi:diguanylate cyclase (GGDEF)-like protein